MATGDEKTPRIKTKPGQLPINQETLDIMVANVIPTSKYFESRFDYLEHRVIKIEEEIKNFRLNSDKQFERVDKRFEQMTTRTDKQFEQVKISVDKRFEQVDKRFDQVLSSIDRLTDKLDNRDNEHRFFTLRMFSISIVISFLGVLGVFLKMFKMV